MSDINILDLLPDDDSKPPEDTKPEWTKRDPLALKAYEAMRSLEEKKQAYLKSHKKKSAFEAKGNYTIKKSDVAKACGKSHPNMIFISNPLFADDALQMFNDINDGLIEQKEKRLSMASNGLQSRSKSELKTEAQSRGDTIKMLEAKLAKNTIDTLRETLPIDVKNKLGIK